MRYRLGDHEPKVHATSYIADSAEVIGNVTIGAYSTIWFQSVLRGDNDAIVIGERSNIQDGVICHTDRGLSLRIGNGVTVGHRAMLHGCTIGEGALIGMGATIMNRAVVGEWSLIGAGSLVPEGKVIPPRSLAYGSPAKVIRSLTNEEVERLQRTADHYVSWGEQYARTLQAIE